MTNMAEWIRYADKLMDKQCTWKVCHVDTKGMAKLYSTDGAKKTKHGWPSTI